MRLFRPGFLAGWLFPEALFRIRTAHKILYLTFDDGPDPASTPVVLHILKTHSIKALFFCDGRAAEKYPYLMDQIVTEGHLSGNHGYYHYDGWRTDYIKYVNDVIKAELFTSPTIFRPPFGHMSLKQYRILKKKFKIVVWDLMPYDFDLTFGSERSLSVLKNKIRRGSIIVLHDSPSSVTNLILDEFITFAVESGYRFELVPLLRDKLRE